ncbi:LacI family transcriptional regulator [Clostridia bacterium]|nr:LacI family transcriptional regulator [Clostridia bacterium]
MTLEDVAKQAKVSTMTVSRVINNSPNVKRATVERVRKIIEELNYRPNQIAKSLVQGSSKTVGVLYSNIYNQIYLDIITGIDSVAYKHDYILMNANVDRYNTAVKTFNMFVGNRIDGLIVLPMEMSMSDTDDYIKARTEMENFYVYLDEAARGLDIPIVTVHQRIEHAYNIAFDFGKLADLAMRHLVGKGFKNIAMLSSYMLDGLWKDKEDIYRRIMQENGLERYIRIERENITPEGGFRAMNKLLRSGEPLCEAVFCSNDYIAVGAVQALNNAGIKIPEQISVIGNDNANSCEMTFPKLTSVSLNPYIAGQTAMETLLRLIGKREPPPEKVIPIAHTLVERGSIR